MPRDIRAGKIAAPETTVVGGPTTEPATSAHLGDLIGFTANANSVHPTIGDRGRRWIRG
ncbi:MAG TPA: hypothetical protein VGR26_15155 [Acidimicrobiales bacterium]|nr:hypothetical protein [Acidimicrobiales bacterium]